MSGLRLQERWPVSPIQAGGHLKAGPRRGLFLSRVGTGNLGRGPAVDVPQLSEEEPQLECLQGALDGYAVLGSSGGCHLAAALRLPNLCCREYMMCSVGCKQKL